MESRGNVPESPRTTIAEALSQWEAARSLGAQDRKAVYISAPITSGPRFIEWRRSAGRHLNPQSLDFQVALRSEVMLPNIQRIARFVEVLRWRHAGLVIDPTTLDIPGWSQNDYHEFWLTVIERHARRLIFLDGWHLSSGCTIEFEKAQSLGLDCVSENLAPLSLERGVELVETGLETIASLGNGVENGHLGSVLARLKRLASKPRTIERRLFKDEVLESLANTANVAQFVSFGPGPSLPQRFCRIRSFSVGHRFGSAREAVEAVFQHSPESKVNIRSFDPERPEGNPFLIGLTRVDDVLSVLNGLASDSGLHTIVNETIDPNDGGVSGVSYRGLIEFAPDSTPRCVDDEDVDTAAFPFELGMSLLQSVYGFEPDLRGREGARVEFSIHPRRRGWNFEHTVIWQSEQRPAPDLDGLSPWPHRFSRFLGDKAFGLLTAHVAGLPVPRTTVFTRRLFPFSFGESTGEGEVWTRTCPEVKEPGYYPSAKGWTDPYEVLNDWRILGDGAAPRLPPFQAIAPLASVIVQQAVRAEFSGRSEAESIGDVRLEGVAGEGDAFMRGEAGGQQLPPEVENQVRATSRKAFHLFGAVSIEWVFDGATVWVVQLNGGRRELSFAAVGTVKEWVPFLYRKGRLEEFREQVRALRGTSRGVEVIGNVSPLSHLGEIAKVQGVPTRFVLRGSES